MKNRSYRIAFRNFIQNVRKNKSDYNTLRKVVWLMIRKLKTSFIQKLNVTLYKVINYNHSRQLKKDIYIIYTMAKVGSSTIYETLRFRIPHSSLFHVHFLTESGLKKRENFHNDPTITATDRQLLQLIKTNPERRLKIITLVREPVSRNISDLFESLSIYFPNKELQELAISDLQQKFKSNGFAHTLSWFDEEFNDFLGINIYDTPFDKNKGYQIYTQSNCDILLIRLENLSVCFKEALKEFTGIDFKVLVNANETKDKSSFILNKEFKAKFKMDKKELEDLYSTKYVKHFYTEKEIKTFIDMYGVQQSIMSN